MVYRSHGVLGHNGIAAQVSARALRVIIGLLIASRFLACPVVVGYQALRWLQTGHWHNIPLRTWPVEGQILMLHPGGFEWWLYEPHSWYGLHVIVKFLLFELPVWVWLIAAFYFIQKWIEIKEKDFTSWPKSKSGRGWRFMVYVVITNGVQYQIVECEAPKNGESDLDGKYPGWAVVGIKNSRQEAEALGKSERDRRRPDSY